MGHWSESLLAEVQERVGPNADPELLRQLLRQAAGEIELLSGRTFGGVEARTETISPGYPFAEIGDAHVASFTSSAKAWPIPDPVNPRIATVVQLVQPAQLAPEALSTGQALWVAGQFVAAAAAGGRLAPEFVLWWLGHTFDPEQRQDYLRQAFDPNTKLYVPIADASLGGWWFQITRRLQWLTRDSPEHHRLVQPLIPEDEMLGGLVGCEPVLIAARMTEHPVKWAMAARIWHGVTRDHRRPWHYAAKAVHGYGLPILTLELDSTSAEIACQLVLLGYWHKYLGSDDLILADALQAAYPKAVDRVRRGARLPDHRAAAALLLEGLINPGFDPARGAEYARRYISRKAAIAVLKQRQLDAPGLREWEQFGVGERSYYKLLAKFASKSHGRYEVDDAVRTRIRKYLESQLGHKVQREAAMELLRERGFSFEAARKWLQRHPIEAVVNAHPRHREDQAV